ncbi:hypothetical protein N7510_005203 [Penicillium lagena]|uniref:uncharacterized protein n=1 Tax=Penicillium lagena TaxID=94218 RepID=UPI0025421155|nr:uncharacterized protein N7510_005203 [Penicillium lagena]KAJ5612009.1 hypothetical protein N7510_005203 [Penicillium lagena]
MAHPLDDYGKPAAPNIQLRQNWYVYEWHTATNQQTVIDIYFEEIMQHRQLSFLGISAFPFILLAFTKSAR